MSKINYPDHELLRKAYEAAAKLKEELGIDVLVNAQDNVVDLIINCQQLADAIVSKVKSRLTPAQKSKINVAGYVVMNTMVIRFKILKNMSTDKV